MNTVYTAGYTGHKPEDLLRRAVELDALLFDIRYSPNSRNPAWRREALQQLFGSRYRWIFALGNRHYRGDGPIDIVDPHKGKDVVHAAIARQPVILLCACPEYEYCHRRTVSELLQREGCAVEELEWDGWIGAEGSILR